METRLTLLLKGGSLMAISFSRLDNFERCPLSYKLRYIDKVPEIKGVALDTGSKVHEVLERYLKAIRQMKMPQYDKDLLRDIASQYTVEDETSIAGLLSKVDFNEIIPINLMNYSSIELRIAVDESWQPVTWDSPLGFYRGIIDAIVYNPSRKILYITDWKTNRNLSANPLQLRSYAALAHAVLSDQLDINEFIVRFYYLRLGVAKEKSFSPTEILWAMDDLSVRLNRMLSATEYPPQLNEYCGYCGVRKSCTLYQEAIEKGSEENIPIEEAVIRYEMSDTIRKDYGKLVKSYVEENGDIDLGEGRRYGLQVTQKRKIDSEKLAFWLRKHPEVDPYEIISRGSFQLKTLSSLPIEEVVTIVPETRLQITRTPVGTEA